jgi:hypothetical protein
VQLTSFAARRIPVLVQEVDSVESPVPPSFRLEVEADVIVEFGSGQVLSVKPLE